MQFDRIPTVRFLPVVLILTGFRLGFPPDAAAQKIVRIGTVAIQGREVPDGWTLISDSSQRADTLASKNVDNLAEEINLRIKEAEVYASLSSFWVQKFECGGKVVEIQYYGGVTDEDMARAYSEIASQGLADAVVHKGRFAIGIHSPSPSLIRTAIDALRPDPLDRIKIIDATLPKEERARAESLANPVMRENLAKHFGILPTDVLNQFFEGPILRQVTYVACANLEDASQAAAALSASSRGKTRVLAEGRYIVEIVGDDGWTESAERMILPRLIHLADNEKKASEPKAEAATRDSREGVPPAEEDTRPVPRSSG